MLAGKSLTYDGASVTSVGPICYDMWGYMLTQIKPVGKTGKGGKTT